MYEKNNSCPFRAPGEYWRLSASPTLPLVYIKFEPTKLPNLKIILIHTITLLHFTGDMFQESLYPLISP